MSYIEIDWLAVRATHTLHPSWKKSHTHIYTHKHTSVGDGLWAGIAIISEQGRPPWQTHPSSVATATTQALKLNTAVRFLFLGFFSRHELLPCMLEHKILSWKNLFTQNWVQVQPGLIKSTREGIIVSSYPAVAPCPSATRWYQHTGVPSATATARPLGTRQPHERDDFQQKKERKRYP